MRKQIFVLEKCDTGMGLCASIRGVPTLFPLPILFLWALYWEFIWFANQVSPFFPQLPELRSSIFRVRKHFPLHFGIVHFILFLNIVAFGDQSRLFSRAHFDYFLEHLSAVIIYVFVPKFILKQFLTHAILTTFSRSLWGCNISATGPHFIFSE